MINNLRRDIKALTLLEILVAMCVFVIGCVSIWSLYATAIETYNRSLDEQNISFLVETVMADLDVSKGKNLQPQKDKHERFPGYEYQINFTELKNDAVFVKLTVSYLRRGQTREEIFHTILYRDYR